MTLHSTFFFTHVLWTGLLPVFYVILLISQIWLLL